jgi:Spy/CpxP family protein refolding chaperone
MTMKPLFVGITAAAALAVAAGAGAWIAVEHGTPPAFAQANGPGATGPGANGPNANGGRRFGRILLSLGLSDVQKSQIRDLMKAARAKNQSVTDPQVKRANMRAAFAQIDQVLTPDQRTQLHAKLQAARKQQQTD